MAWRRTTSRIEMKYRRGNALIRKGLGHFIFVFFLFVVCVDPAFPQKTDQIVLFHVKSLTANKEFVLQSLVETCLETLKHSNKVIIYFDLEAVKAIKIGSWYGGDITILDKVDLNNEQRRKLSANLKISLASIPSNYGELFRLIRGKGIELYTNETILKKLGLGDEEYDMVFVPIGNEQFVEILLNSDVYVSY